LAALLTLSTLLAGQTPPETSPQPPASTDKTASIEGVVHNASTGEPIPHVHVILRGIAIEFPVHPIQETGKRPTAGLDRNLAYLGLVEVLYGYPLDGVVLIDLLRLIVELAVEALAHVRLRSQRRATLRRTDQRKMDTRFVIARPDNFILEVFKCHDLPAEAYDQLPPGCAMKCANITNALEWVMINDQPKRPGVAAASSLR